MDGVENGRYVFIRSSCWITLYRRPSSAVYARQKRLAAGAKTLRLLAGPSTRSNSKPSLHYVLWSLHADSLNGRHPFAIFSPWPLPPVSQRTGTELRLSMKPSRISTKMPSQALYERPPLWVLWGCSSPPYKTPLQSKMSQHGV